ncbi:MAG: hypothetical protein V4478_02350 [Patescibacteria group bacterium]
MKKLIRTLLVLIGTIATSTAAHAQYETLNQTQYTGYDISTSKGTGLFTLHAQGQTGYGPVYSGVETALFGNRRAALAMFRGDLPGLTPENLMDLQGYWLKMQLGGTFDPTNRSRYLLNIYPVNTPQEAERLWTKYDDGYVIKGDNKLSFCKPLSSPNYQFKPFWYAIVTDKQTGLSALLRANCGNPMPLAGTGTYNEDVVVASNSVVRDPNLNVQQTVYVDRNQQSADRNTELPKKEKKLSTGAKVVIGAVILTGLGLAAKAIFGKKGGNDTTHDPTWQPPSTTPWPDGGSVDGPKL